MDDLTILAARANLIRMKRADDDQSALTSLGGNLMSYGAPLAVMGHGSRVVGNALAPSVKAWGDAYDPRSHRVVQQYLSRDAAATNAAQAMENHIMQGHRMLSMRPYGNLRGIDILQRVYDRFGPMIAKVIPGAGIAAGGFSRPSAEHYGQFVRGPAAALEQLGREMQHQHGYMTRGELASVNEARNFALQKATEAARAVTDPAQRAQVFQNTYRQTFGQHLGYGQLSTQDRHVLKFYPDEKSITEGTLSGTQKQELLNTRQQLAGKQFGFAHSGQYGGGRNAAISAMETPRIPDRIAAQGGQFADTIEKALPADQRAEAVLKRLQSQQGTLSKADQFRDRLIAEQKQVLRQGMRAQYQALRSLGIDKRELAGVLKDQNRLGQYYQQHGDVIRQRSQEFFDRADQIKQRLGQLGGLRQRIVDAPQQALQRATSADVAGQLAGGNHDLHLRKQMVEALRQNPTYAKHLAGLGDLSKIENVDLTKLPANAQRWAVRQVIKSDPIAQAMALNFGKHYATGPGQYGRLGQIITAPGRVAKPLGNVLGGMGRWGGPIGNVGLGMLATGLPTWIAGKAIDASRPGMRELIQQQRAEMTNLRQSLGQLQQQLAQQQSPMMMAQARLQLPPGVPQGIPKMSSDDIPPMPGQSMTTTVGNTMALGGGTMGILGGLAKLQGQTSLDSTAAKLLASPHAPKVTGIGNRVGSWFGLDRAGDKVWQSQFSKLPWQQRLAIRGAMHGGKAGLAGLGIMGLGMLIGNQGMKSDNLALRRHGETLADMIRKQRQASPARQIETPQVQQQLAQENVASRARGVLSRGQSAGDGLGARAALAEAANSATTGAGDMRVHNFRELLRQAGGALKGWWQRMNRVYGGQ